MDYSRFMHRGKNYRTGEWVYGYYVKNKPNEHFIFTQDNLKNEWDIHIIDPKTLGQCTGLIDANGSYIFENDIIKWPYANGKVVLINGCFRIMEINDSGSKTFYDLRDIAKLGEVSNATTDQD